MTARKSLPYQMPASGACFPAAPAPGARPTARRLSVWVMAGLLATGSAWAQGSGTSSGGGAAAGPGNAGGAMGSSGSPTAQSGTGNRNTAEQSRLARADRRFIEQAAASGLHELQAAQLATTRATDPAVKDYAAMLAQHHGSANSELSQLAATLGVELPSAPPRAMRNELERLGKRTGAEFDREFVREIGIKEHERDIKRFQSASKDVKEPQLKAWIDKTLPVLQQHLAAAQRLPQAGGEAAASTRTQQERMGAGQGGYGSGTGTSPGGAGSGDSGSRTGP